MARIKKPDIKRVPPEEVAKALGAEPVCTEACKQYHTHDDQQPAGYIARSDWGMRMSRTHKQSKCPACGLYRVWTPKNLADSDNKEAL